MDQSKYHIEFKLPGLPKTTNAHSAKNHWAHRYREAVKWKNAVLPYLWHIRPPQPLTQAKLTLTRYSSREPDFDGLVSSFKHVIDALVEGKIILNDKMSVIGQPVYRWEKVKHGEGHISIRVEEV